MIISAKYNSKMLQSGSVIYVWYFTVLPSFGTPSVSAYYTVLSRRRHCPWRGCWLLCLLISTTLFLLFFFRGIVWRGLFGTWTPAHAASHTVEVCCTNGSFLTSSKPPFLYHCLSVSLVLITVIVQNQLRYLTWFQEPNFLACMCTQLAFIHDCEMLAESRRHSAVLHI